MLGNLFSGPAFLGRVVLIEPRKRLGYSQLWVDWIAEQICTILEANYTEHRAPEMELYRNEFNRWYDKVSDDAGAENALAKSVARRCPDRMRNFNAMRSDFLRQERERINASRRPPPLPPLPPMGPPVASGDPYQRYRPVTPTPLPPPPPMGPPVASGDPYKPYKPPPPPPPVPTISIMNPPVPTGQVSMTPVQDASANQYSESEDSGQREDVASVDCGPGQVPDGYGGCRGSVAPGFSNLVNQAMNLGPSGMTMPGAGAGGYSSGGAPAAYSMGRRYPVVNV